MCSECWIEKAVLWELEERKGENMNSRNWDHYCDEKRAGTQKTLLADYGINKKQQQQKPDL